jgi:polysaccharide biosynthesis/export protein
LRAHLGPNAIGLLIHVVGKQGELRGIEGTGAVRRFCGFLALALLASLCGGGCSFLPGAGPESWDIRAGQRDPEGLPYALIKLTPRVTDILANYVPRLATAFPDRRPPSDIRFGIGDVVSVTIFEASAGGLFIPSEAGVRPGNFVTLPAQSVDVKGNISVPYAGTIRAVGRTQVEVQTAIVDALKNRAIEPQVVVSLTDQRTSMISVLGDVNSSQRLLARATPERMLDAIARAGGPRNQGYDEWVMLERNGRRAVAPFGALVYEPRNNIYVHPNDTIYLYREPQTFLAFGAVGSAAGSSGTVGGTSTITISSGSQIAFDAWRLSLAEAIARVGGLADGLADAASVFLYRGETREVAEALGIDCRPFAGPIIPVIYNVNFRDPAGYFLATKFEMRSKDVIYVANAPAVETAKAMTYFRLVVGTVNDPITAAINAYALKAAIQGAGSASTAVLVGGPTSGR